MTLILKLWELKDLFEYPMKVIVSPKKNTNSHMLIKSAKTLQGVLGLSRHPWPLGYKKPQQKTTATKHRPLFKRSKKLYKCLK